MKKSMPPVCFFPTTVCLVDDNAPFLNNLSLKLDPSFLFSKYQDPLKALQDIKDKIKTRPFLEKCSSLVFNDELDIDTGREVFFDLKTSLVHEELYNPKRFDQLSVLVVDYNMPEMSGIEFCEQLKGSPIKKIMLTGEAELDLAVQAFNKGIIDRFIQKGSPHVFSELNEGIRQLQWEYFQEQSIFIHQNLSTHPHFALSDPDCQSVFHDILKSEEYSEFYLLDNSGSYLFVDWYGKTSWLLIKSESEMEAYCEIARDQKGPTAIIDALENKTHLPFLMDEADHKKAVAYWKDDLYTAQPIERSGKTIAYYALIRGNLNSQNTNRIIWSHQERTWSLADGAKLQGQH